MEFFPGSTGIFKFDAMFYLGLDVQPEIPILKELYSMATAYVDGST